MMVAVGIAACAPEMEDPADELIGEWIPEHYHSANTFTVMEFKENHRMTRKMISPYNLSYCQADVSTAHGDYIVDEGLLKTTINGVNKTYNYRLVGDNKIELNGTTYLRSGSTEELSLISNCLKGW